jgi:CHAT domain-containing protein
VIIRRAQRGTLVGEALTGKRQNEVAQLGWRFKGLVKAISRTAPDPRNRAGLQREMFQAAQWAQSSEAAASLAQMAARGARDDPKLAVLVRERQDLVAEWQKRDATRSTAVAQAPDKRDRQAETENVARLTAVDSRIADIDKQLAVDFPDYAALANPAPLSVEDVQKKLGEDEALILFLDTAELKPTPEETFIWVITKNDLRWARSDLGTPALTREVAALRCGLDYEGAWSDSGADCSTLLKAAYKPLNRTRGDPLPFDLARAHGVYQALFGQVEDVIKNKRLLIVPSGPLTQLPFQVLVPALVNERPSSEYFRDAAQLGAEMESLTEDDRKRLQWTGDGGIRIVKVLPGSAAEAAWWWLKADDVLLAIDDERAVGVQQTLAAISARAPHSWVQLTSWREGQKIYPKVMLGAAKWGEWPPLFLDAANSRAVHWLARDHAITVLPAVSSLRALRELAKESNASEPYIGFGNPLLDGDPAKFKDDAAAAKLAREKRCDPTVRQRVASLFGLRGGSRIVARSSGGAINVADLRTWAPLPETADEVCDVAHDLGVDPATHVYLGTAATETKIKQLSETGALAKSKIVHFATHGAVAGEISSATEPGLLLTPPDKASDTDDGYLSASEIAGLKLDADWVILSACNTAAGDAKGAESLSGLARAFFYAGARSLLVSHWEVASEPTVKLITKAVDEFKYDPKIGRAEALRRSMLSMIDTGKPYEAHPAFWAPFVLVGEGGAAR